MPTDTLKVTDLTCRRRDRALFNHINFTLSNGQVLHIHGANGSGKTSLLRILCHLDQPQSGCVHWCSEKISECRETYHSALNYLGHTLGLSQYLTPVENLQLSCELHQRSAAAGILEVLAEFGLAQVVNEWVMNLSAGQQRRVALARLRLIPTTLWILDEPLAALDQCGIRLLENLLESHAKQGGIVIYTSHQALVLNDIHVRQLELGL